MTRYNIGILHPGAMGISLAATAINSGHQAYWVSSSRSSDTRQRAEKYGLVENQSLEQLCGNCSIVISVCPPHAAKSVAEQVISTGFDGIFADVNAISPGHAEEIHQRMTAAGIRFVDGGIVGPPAWKEQTTWLYLAGQDAAKVAGCFQAGPLATEVMGDTVGAASAFKMCFAIYSKGTTALLCATLAAAEKLGIRKELEAQWSRNNPSFVNDTHSRISQAALKAWRFTGEMDEIAATFGDAGVPDGFPVAAGEIYQRLAEFKNAPPGPSIEDVLKVFDEQSRD